MKVECPYCKEKYDVKRSQLEMEAICAMCNNSFILHIDGVAPKRKKPVDKKKVLMISVVSVVVVILAGGGYYLHSKGFDFMKLFKKSENQTTENNSAGNAADPAAIAKTKLTVSNNNLKQISMGILNYSTDNNEQLPLSLNELITSGALPDFNIYIAPFDKKSVVGSGELKPENTSYAYVGAKVKYGSAVPVLFEKPWLLPEDSSQINVLSADGQIQTVTINGVSKMTCRQVVEELTKESQEKALVDQLVKNAEQEDSGR